MKADHRHELKTNELADWLAHFPQWAQENRSTLIGAGVVIVVVMGVYFVRFYRKGLDVRQHAQLTNLVTQVSAQKRTIAQAAGQGTDQSVTLLPLVQDLQSFAEGSGNDRMAALALIKRAEALRSELHYRLTDATGEEVATQIAQAQASYRQALERAGSVPTLAAAAQLGLGLCDEELGNFEEAKTAYRGVAENAAYAGTAAQAAAAYRLKTMDDYKGAVVFKPAPEPKPATASTPTIQLGPDGVTSPIMIQAPEGVSEVPIAMPATPDSNAVPGPDAGAVEAVEVNEPAAN